MTKEIYKQVSSEYKKALRLVEAYLENLNEMCEEIDSVETRIKTHESLEEKCTRKGVNSDDIKEVKNNIRDIAGARINVQFKDNVPRIVELIRNNIQGIAIMEEKDYFNNPKKNGYSSYHLIVSVQFNLLGKGTILVPIEIQVRTMAQNIWATAEHVIRYKSMNTENDPIIDEGFMKIAQYLNEIDAELMRLRDHKNNKPAE